MKFISCTLLEMKHENYILQETKVAAKRQGSNGHRKSVTRKNYSKFASCLSKIFSHFIINLYSFHSQSIVIPYSIHSHSIVNPYSNHIYPSFVRLSSAVRPYIVRISAYTKTIIYNSIPYGSLKQIPQYFPRSPP